MSEEQELERLRGIIHASMSIWGCETYGVEGFVDAMKDFRDGYERLQSQVDKSKVRERNVRTLWRDVVNDLLDRLEQA